MQAGSKIVHINQKYGGALELREAAPGAFCFCMM